MHDDNAFIHQRTHLLHQYINQNLKSFNNSEPYFIKTGSIQTKFNNISDSSRWIIRQNYSENTSTSSINNNSQPYFVILEHHPEELQWLFADGNEDTICEDDKNEHRKTLPRQRLSDDLVVMEEQLQWSEDNDYNAERSNSWYLGKFQNHKCNYCLEI